MLTDRVEATGASAPCAVRRARIAVLTAAALLASCGRLEYDPVDVPGALDADVPDAQQGDAQRLDARPVDADAAGVPGDAMAPDAGPLPCLLGVPLERRDTDGDGVLDVYDDDDDDDGLTDARECFWFAPTLVINGGFEQPTLTDPGGAITYADSAVPGWRAVSGTSIEIWASGHNGVEAAGGGQLAELQATALLDGVYQDLQTPRGGTLRWAFWHRSRVGRETVEVSFGPPGAAADLRLSFTSEVREWVLHAGTYVVPAGQPATRIQLIATEGTSSSSGNLVDEVIAQPLCTVDSDGDGCVDSEDRD